ncbi:MAG: glycosyl hydrolase family 18 protein [Parafilimonas sp.]
MKLLLFISLFSFLLSSDNEKKVQQEIPFKIVGYYSLKYAMEKSVADVPFNKLTHINLFFLNPDTKGKFKQNLSALVPFIQCAHADNVKVLFSICGGGKHAYYANLLKDSSRKIFINNLVNLVMKYNADGIDNDIEGSDIDENYDNFSVELATALHQHNKLFTAAIAIYFKDDYTNKALAQYDFLNLMSYDHTGAWAPKKPGPHSTYEQAIDDLNYFRNVRGIPKDKITLGVPFYGYGFGPKHQTRAVTMNYNDIVNTYPGSELKDEFDMGDGTILYYNGMNTIKQKTMLAEHDASGIMIWQLSGDADSSKSLLNEINDVIKEAK